MFTRKHYKHIADIIKDSTINMEGSLVLGSSSIGVAMSKEIMLTRLCKMFRKDNEKFDEDKFRKACQ